MACLRIRNYSLKPMLWSYDSIFVPTMISNIFKHPLLWRFVGIVSSTVGLLCYALSSSFQCLYGRWNFLKIILYSVVSLITFCIMLFPEKLQFSRKFRLKYHVVFLVLILTSFYSVFYDKDVNEKPDVLSLTSNGAFALMSLSLSKQIQLGFELGLSTFFLGCFIVQLIKINLKLTSVVAFFCYSLIALRSYMNSKLEIGQVSDDDQLAIEIGTTNGASFKNLDSLEIVPKHKVAKGADKVRKRLMVKPEHSSSRIRELKRGVAWTEEEHKLLLLGLDECGKGDWRNISRKFVKTRTPAQVATHALKFIRAVNANRRRRRSNQFDISMEKSLQWLQALNGGGTAGGNVYSAGKSKVWQPAQDIDLNDLLAVLGYKVESSDMADNVEDDFYDPTQLPGWVESMLAELNPCT